MGFGTGFAIYFIIWWVVLFTVLPFSARSQAEEGDVTLGTTHSALSQFPLRADFLAHDSHIFCGFWCLFSRHCRGRLLP